MGQSGLALLRGIKKVGPVERGTDEEEGSYQEKRFRRKK